MCVFISLLLVNDLFMVIESVVLIQFSEEARVKITVQILEEMWKLVIALATLNTILASRTIPNPLEKSESELILNRQKRFLIFPNGGTAKFVGGYLGPVDTVVETQDTPVYSFAAAPASCCTTSFCRCRLRPLP